MAVPCRLNSCRAGRQTTLTPHHPQAPIRTGEAATSDRGREREREGGRRKREGQREGEREKERGLQGLGVGGWVEGGGGVYV